MNWSLNLWQSDKSGFSSFSSRSMFEYSLFDCPFVSVSFNPFTCLAVGLFVFLWTNLHETLHIDNYKPSLLAYFRPNNIKFILSSLNSPFIENLPLQRHQQTKAFRNIFPIFSLHNSIFGWLFPLSAYKHIVICILISSLECETKNWFNLIQSETGKCSFEIESQTCTYLFHGFISRTFVCRAKLIFRSVWRS